MNLKISWMNSLRIRKRMRKDKNFELKGIEDGSRRSIKLSGTAGTRRQ